MYRRPPSLSAWVIHTWIGWFITVVVIRVVMLKILLVRRYCGDTAVNSRFRYLNSGLPSAFDYSCYGKCIFGSLSYYLFEMKMKFEFLIESYAKIFCF